jgi:hypothetical protein
MPIAATKVLIGSLAKDLGRLRDVGDGFSLRSVLRDLPPAIARTRQRGGLNLV